MKKLNNFIYLPYRLIQSWWRYGVRGGQPNLIVRFTVIKTMLLVYRLIRFVKKSENEAQLTANSQHYEELGYLPITLPDGGTALVQKISSLFDKLIRNPKYTVALPREICTEGSDPGEKDKYFQLLGQPLLRIPEIQILVDHYLGDQLSNLLGGEYWISSASLSRRKPLDEDKRKTETYNNYWHCDYRRDEFKWVRVIINLNYHDEHSAFRMIRKGVSLQTVVEQGQKRYESDEALPNNLKNEQKIYHSGSLGTCIFVCTADCYHRGNEPASGTTRDSIHLQVKSLSIKWDRLDGYQERFLVKQGN